MPKQTPDGGAAREAAGYKIVQQQINNTFQLRVVTAQQYAKIEEQLAIQAGYKSAQAKLKAEKGAHDAALRQLAAQHQAAIQQIQAQGYSARKEKSEIAKAELAYIQQVEAERRSYQANRMAFEAQVAQVASTYADNYYQNANIRERQLLETKRSSLATQHAQALAQQRAEYAERIAELQATANQYAANSRIRKGYEAEITQLKAEQAAIDQQIATVKAEETAAYQEQRRLAQIIRDAQVDAVKQTGVGAASLLQGVEAAATEAKAKLEQLKVDIETNTTLGIDTTALEAEYARVADTVTDLTATASSLYKAAASDTANKEHEAARTKLEKVAAKDPTDMARAMADERDIERAETDKQAAANWEYFLSPEGIKDNLGKAVANAVENVAAQISQSLNQIDDNINNFYKYQSSVEARLQGSDESYKKSLKNISKNVGISGLVSQKDVIENLKKLSEAGIAYNLDLRAFLATIKDDIAETFDVFDSNLMRLIRLQQSDTTAARLGMEASLTRLFNEFFSDTSYLTDAADTVSQAIIDANSQLTKNMSVEFEYMVQKWLGSLYSLGMDSGTISTIAQGLNYLGTGNVEALNGNESLQSLLAMSASRAGISYADILTGGLDADTTNNLMKSMIEYLKSIAENTDNNQVTKSAYSNVFGFSISDLTAVSSLSETDIANIHKQSIDYEGAMDEYEYQANQIFNRTHFSQMLNTVFDNAIMSASTAIGNSAGTYAVWKVLNVVEDLTGGIAIPGISIFGNMVDLHQTVTGLAKTGIAGLGLMGSLLGSLFNGSMFGTTAVDKWGYEEFTSRGSATKGISKGTAQGTSESTSMNMVGSSSADDIKSTSMNDATDEADEDSKVTNKNVEENADIYAKIYEAIANEETSVLSEAITTNELLRTHTFKTSSEGLSDLLDPARIFYTAIVSSIPLIGREQLELRDSGAFYVNQEKLDQLYQSQEIVYSAIKSSSVASSTTYDALLTAFESFASDTSSTQSNTNEKTTVETTSGNHFDGVWPVITLLTSAYESLKENATTWALLQSDETKISEAVYTKTLQELKATAEPSAEAQLAVENITSLVDSVSKWETLVAASEAQYNSESYNVTFPNSLQTSLADMSPEVTALIERLVTNALTKVFTGNSTTSQDEEMPLSKLIENVLTQTFNVNVTNDNFDTALQKTAFTT